MFRCLASPPTSLVFSLLLVSKALVLNGCVFVPIPDEGAEPINAALPAIGEDESSVRARLGQPDEFDSGPYLLYEWGSDSKAFFVVTPLGMPAFGVTDQVRTRLLVTLDAQRKVSEIDCSIATVSDVNLQRPVPCQGPPEPGPGSKIFTHSLDPSTQGPHRWSRWHLSPDARYVAVTEEGNRTTLIDVKEGRTVMTHQGSPISFWSINPPGVPHVLFSHGDGSLLIAQAGLPPLRFDREGDGFGPGQPLLPVGLDAMALPCCAEGYLGLRDKTALWIDAGGSIGATSTAEGRLAFDRHGAVVERPLPESDFNHIALDASAFTRSTRAIVTRDGAANGVLGDVLDTTFSPDGKWLARSTCTHVEIYSHDNLFEALRGRPGTRVVPHRVLMRTLKSAGLRDPFPCEHGVIAFDLNARLFALAEDGDTVNEPAMVSIWRFDEGTPFTQLKIHEHRVIRALRFSPTGELLVLHVVRNGNHPKLTVWGPDGGGQAK